MVSLLVINISALWCVSEALQVQKCQNGQEESVLSEEFSLTYLGFHFVLFKQSHYIDIAGLEPTMGGLTAVLLLEVVLNSVHALKQVNKEFRTVYISSGGACTCFTAHTFTYSSWQKYWSYHEIKHIKMLYDDTED